jgi:hypothetical protein
MVDDKPVHGRLTIEERAAQRDRMGTSDGDRYDALVDTLRARGAVPRMRELRVRTDWHPIARKLLLVAAVLLLGYFGLQRGIDYFRDQRVDTWSGPDATVQSGQRLADCPVVNDLHHDFFPTWVRWDGTIYRLVDEIRPVADRGGGEVSITKSGYQLGSMLLLLDDTTPQGVRRDFIVLLAQPSNVGQVFRRTPDCR